MVGATRAGGDPCRAVPGEARNTMDACGVDGFIQSGPSSGSQTYRIGSDHRLCWAVCAPLLSRRRMFKLSRKAWTTASPNSLYFAREPGVPLVCEGEAEVSSQRALDVARRQAAKSLQLWAAMHLGQR